MSSNLFNWNNYIPLTSQDAKEAIRKGVQVFSLRPNGKTVPVASEADVRKNAKKGYVFAAKYHQLKQAVTTYTMDYRIIHPVSGPAMEMKTPENGLWLTVESEDRFNLFDNGEANFSKLAKQHGCPDGEYWAEYVGYSHTFGKRSCTDVDEGVITIKNGEVVMSPDNFWLPF